MATGQLNRVLHHLRRTVLALDGGGRTDGQLLEAFLTGRDEDAFAVLVRRHGSTVLGVCRRVLGNVPDAEDAFQATFLVLVRKASVVGRPELVGNWLYGVAYRTALEARSRIVRRRMREKQVTDMPQPVVEAEETWHELVPLLDQEVNGLPEKYRVPIVLCDLEGQTRKEAARKLKLPLGTLSGRLTTARKLLAERLGWRGVTLSAGALATVLSQNGAQAVVPPALVLTTAKTASLYAAGAAGLPAKVAALTEGVLKAMFLTKLKTLGAVVLAFFLVAGAALVGPTLGNRAASADQTPAAQDKPAPEKPALAPEKQDKPGTTDKAAPAKDNKDAGKGPATIKTVNVTAVANVIIRQTGKEAIDGAPVQPGDVPDGTLVVDGINNVEIEVKELPAIKIDGAGSLQAIDVKGKRLVVTIAGSGFVKVSGTVEEQEIAVNGLGTFDGKELKGKQATVRVSGNGDVVVNVTDKLQASVSGTGSLKYVGLPKVEEDVTGLGEIRQLREGEGIGNRNARAGAGRFGAPGFRGLPGFLPEDARLGAVLERPSPTLVDQLALPKGQGMLLQEVKPDSAAAKAGLKSHDILLELDAKPVPSDEREFAKLLGEIKAKTPVDAVVLRKGKKETIKGLTLPEADPNP